MAGQEGGFNPVDYMARLAALNGANSGGGGGAASGGGVHVGGTASKQYADAAQGLGHNFATLEAAVDSAMGHLGLGFGKTASLADSLSYDGGLFNMFGQQQSKFLGILSDSQGHGNALANFAKFVQRDLNPHLYELHNIYSAGGAAVDTHVAIDAPPATPGMGGMRGGGMDVAT